MKKYLIFFLFITLSCAAFAAGETDKYYSPTMSSNFTLYVVAPDKVAGWCLPLRDYEKRYMRKAYAELPVLGGWRDGGILDKEKIVSLKIKKAFIISSDDTYVEGRLPELKQLGMTITMMRAKELPDYIPLLRELGREMGVPERGEELASYAEKALARTDEMVKGIPDAKKVRVYWALGPDGLSSACNGAIELAGGINVHKCGGDKNFGVNFEQVMAYDPDVIITINPVSAQRIAGDPKWRRLRAYKEGRIYAVPFGPFGWMHAPEITRFLGIQWLACTLYPDRCGVDIKAEAKKFTKLFYHIDLTDSDLKEIMKEDMFK